ncbi:hypothetical protein [Methyloversatilis sp.]|uniref:hypothetical protein n=1 Tax=Methyloversatilis sp. TaxID=2569862 RepID=UPI003D2A5624
MTNMNSPHDPTPERLREERLERWLEIYKGMIQISIEGFRISALANGGAAVALLTFLGSDGGYKHAQAMKLPMGLFLAGLIFCALCILYSYNNHGSFAREIDPDEALAQGADGPDFRVKVRQDRQRQLRVARTFFMVSMIFFAAGAGAAVYAFGEHNEAQKSAPKKPERITYR